MQVSKAIFTGHSTFLSRPVWKTVPWENDPLSKGPIDYLFDILCDTSVYLEDLRMTGDLEPARGHVLKAQVVDSINQLDVWWRYWLCAGGMTCEEVTIDVDTTMYTKDSKGVIYPTLLVYNSLGTAYTVCTYNATRMLLLEALQSLSYLQPHTATYESPHEPNDKVPLLGISSDVKGLAHEIFRSAEYLHTMSEQFMVSFSSMFIFDIAYSALEPQSREAKWLLSKLALPMRSMHSKNDGTYAKAITVLPTCRLLQPV